MRKMIRKYIKKLVQEEISKEKEDVRRRIRTEAEVEVAKAIEHVITQITRDVHSLGDVPNHYSVPLKRAIRNAGSDMIRVYRQEINAINRRHNDVDQMKKQVYDLAKSYIESEAFLDRFIERVKKKQL